MSLKVSLAKVVLLVLPNGKTMKVTIACFLERMNIYVSEKDDAMGASRFLHDSRDRLGQMWKHGDMADYVRNFIIFEDRLDFVNVTGAEDATKGNGHDYFRRSPWVSSDVMMTLFSGAPPEQRGLVASENGAFWEFPPDYLDRLKEAVLAAAAE